MGTEMGEVTVADCCSPAPSGAPGGVHCACAATPRPPHCCAVSTPAGGTAATTAAPPRGRRLMSALWAELLGTAVLVFLGCMGGVRGVVSHPSLGHSSLSVALVSGMAVAAVIQMVGHVSEAHVNPAVTLGRLLRGGFGLRAAAGYLLAQLCGALLGYRLLLAVTPPSATCDCTTTPSSSLSPPQALLVEAAGAAGLVLQCHASWDGHLAGAASLQFGFYMAAISLAAGPYTGGSLNPARSLAPAIWTGVWTHHWVYWVGPLLGSTAATLFYLLALGGRVSPTTAAAAAATRSGDSEAPPVDKCVVPTVCF